MNNYCTICNGKSNSARGNEKIVDGVVMCDHCTAYLMSLAKSNPGKYRIHLGNSIYQFVGIGLLFPELRRHAEERY